MVKRKTIEFIEARHPIPGRTTKFGGHPTWMSEPQWPTSRATGNPMRFICQITIEAELFAPASGQMAYLFMTDEDEYVDGTSEQDGGENAVVLQPGHIMTPAKPLMTGPSLYRM